MTEIRQVKHGSPEYDATVELRRAVLRRPLGLDFTLEQLRSEGLDTHFAILSGEIVIACLILSPVDATRVKMRQVAVSPNHQGQGLGRQLVRASEDWARSQGFERMELHARETAVPFYLSGGYEIEGEPFEEVSIPHRSMFKRLLT